uniref:Uncharacterized protein n=1 Tax=Cacopsylla melanoneura TaxID=428564 RepID=A0A8D8TPG7_9HEMI
MSKRRSVSNKQSEEQVVCINVKGLDTLCGRGSDSSVDSEGSNDEDYEEGGDGANCDECGASFTIIASPCSKHDKVGKGGGGGGGFRPPSPYYQPPPPGYPPRYPPQQGQYGGGPPRGPPMGGPMYGGPQQQMYGPRPGGPPPPQHVHNHGPPQQQQRK